MRLRLVGLAVAVTMMLGARIAGAQSTNGTISGRVADAQGLALPGVTISVTSPNLQGPRASVTSEIGDYAIPLLPPGTYTLTFELAGFQKQEIKAILAPTQRLPVNVTLGQVTMAEEVTVVGAPAHVVTQSAQVATNFRQGLTSTLPTNRDINASVLLAPSVHATGVGGAYSIAGAMSFESLFMINGVSVSDNIRGQPYDLYIEDAVQETTIATAGISAEYGRFSGGVVNVITKSGGNEFSGSFRDSLLNDKWRAFTPFEQKMIAADPKHVDTRVDKTVPTYEYTLGGPIERDRLWFFAAGRNQKQESGRALILTSIPYTFQAKQRRNEGKITYSPRVGHRLQGAFIDSFEEQANQAQNPANVMDSNSLYNAKHPMNLFTLEYAGVWSRALVVEGRFSARNETFKGVGATTRDLVDGTLLVDRNGRRYWSPTFCGVCGPEQRDGQEAFAKGSYFLSTRGLGSHQMVFGYDGYNDRRVANNYQSGSDYRILNTTVVLRDGKLYPQFIADGATLIQWNPVFTPSSGTNFRTHSLFYNDNWRVSNRVTANLGLRYDRNHGIDSSETLVASTDAWSPRLGVVIDPFGDQKWSVTGNVAKYVDGIANLVANAAASGGNADTYQFAYLGPDINKDSNGTLTETAEAIQQVFTWFENNDGLSRANTGIVNVVGVSTVIGKNLKSPSVWEYATGVNRQLGDRAAIRADVVVRRYHDFYSLRTDTTTGTVVDTRPNAPVSVAGRRYDLSVVENTTIPKRRYEGLSLQGQYRFDVGIDAGMNYTLSHASGNIDGETAAGPGGAVVSQYPEFKQASWNYPDGDLAIDQRHRARIWASYTPNWFSGLALSALQTLESGVPYGAVSNQGVNPQGWGVVNPGYLTPPSGVNTTYYFTARDAFHTEGQERTDLAASYHYSLRSARGLQLFGQLQVLNAFNHYQLCACGASTVFGDGGAIMLSRIDQTVLTPVTSSKLYQTFNPFTTTPVRGVNWEYGPSFGKALNRFAYTTPRTIRLTFGVRF